MQASIKLCRFFCKQWMLGDGFRAHVVFGCLLLALLLLLNYLPSFISPTIFKYKSAFRYTASKSRLQWISDFSHIAPPTLFFPTRRKRVKELIHDIPECDTCMEG